MSSHLEVWKPSGRELVPLTGERVTLGKAPTNVVALEHDLSSAALRAYNNVADLEARSDRYERAAAGYRDGLALARRVGSRQQEWMFLAQTYPLYALGRWDDALAGADEVPQDVFSQTRFPFVCFLGNSVAIHCHRGELDAAAELIERYAVLRESADLTERASYAWPEAQLLLASGRRGTPSLPSRCLRRRAFPSS